MTPLAQAERLLRDNGIGDARVSSAGHAHDVAVIVAPPQQLVRLQELAPRIKALGFRYVTLDLAGTGDTR